VISLEDIRERLEPGPPVDVRAQRALAICVERFRPEVFVVSDPALRGEVIVRRAPRHLLPDVLEFWCASNDYDAKRALTDGNESFTGNRFYEWISPHVATVPWTLRLRPAGKFEVALAMYSCWDGYDFVVETDREFYRIEWIFDPGEQDLRGSATVPSNPRG
jgi:hypothetical protein